MAKAKKNSPSKKKQKDSRVAFVSDPMGSPLLDVAEAQATEEELLLDEELTPDNWSEEDLGQLADKMTAYTEEAQKEEIDLTSEELDEDLLAQQIQEDQALEGSTSESDTVEISGQLDRDEAASYIETLLFLSDKALSKKKLYEMLSESVEQKIFKEALDDLIERYQQPHHGIELCEIDGCFQFRTKPGRAHIAKKLAQVQTQRLSRGAMETLAIIAYKQPAMKDDIDKIRGVDSTYFLRGLLDRRLIKMGGRSELPGRPILYETTPEFMQIFGIKSLNDLPPLREIEAMIPASETAPQTEDPEVAKMRHLVETMHEEKDRINYNPEEDKKILEDLKTNIGSIPVTTAYLEEIDRQEQEQTQGESTAGEA